MQARRSGSGGDGVLTLPCRSAKRSVPAARAATAEGYTAYNISFGFLGVLDKATGE